MKPRILLSLGVMNEPYIEVVRACGGRPAPMFDPPVCTDYDGLILCGGPDLDPAHYGEAPNGSVAYNYAHDAAEIALAKAFIAAKKPILGICRGSQLLNVVFGGTLIQHIAEAAAHATTCDPFPAHSVHAAEGSFLRDLYGADFTVNSAHHQAVRRLGDGLEVILTAENGTMVEGFRHKSLPVIGLQFHPEKMCCSERREDTVDGRAIFEHFLSMCSIR
ncbi:MAG: type 1 glutamine amidotransferase [Oscillospiraceae bacterium]|nr:type 1 glutamine amidotransferase [Oscillospiraceae bacterium]